MKSKALSIYTLLLFLVLSCNDDVLEPLQPLQEANASSGRISLQSELPDESFESGNKSGYAAANVSFSAGSWYFSDALIGNLSSDRKRGSQAVRVRNSGHITMNYDLSGATTIRVLHALYGSDSPSSWQLWMSTNSGSSFSRVGSTVLTSSTSLRAATFSVSVSGTVRFQIRKTTGGSDRINFDDFQVTSSASNGRSPGDDSHLLFGNPGNATSNTSNSTNYLMNKTYYALSYNRSKGTPNWVSWHVDHRSLGNTSRQDDFRSDTSLPASWYRVGSSAYSGSGFDRGHNCPSGDRTSSVSSNLSTFLMTNMIPQAPNHNRYLWANFENYIRSLIDVGNEAYVIMGRYGQGGSGTNGTAATVPNSVWKVVLILPEG